jgi:hypothetical protein
MMDIEETIRHLSTYRQQTNADFLQAFFNTVKMLAVTRQWVVQTMDEIVDETTLLIQLEQKNANAERVLRAQ